MEEPGLQVSRKAVLVVLFIPSVERDGVTAINQEYWTLDMERIAKELGAERRGKVSAPGGYFGALQLTAEIAARFRVPEGGGAQPIRRGVSNALSGSLRRRSSSSRSSPNRRTQAPCKWRHSCLNKLCRP
jgi:hypothetical protein